MEALREPATLAVVPQSTRLLRLSWACAAYLIASILILLTNLHPPLVRLLTRSPVVGFLAALAAVALIMGLQLWIIYEESALPISAGPAIFLAAVLGPIGFFLPRLAVPWVGPSVYMLVLSPWRNLLLLVAGVALGVWVSRALRDAGMLIPTVLVAALVDFWGVYFGSTLYFVATNPELVEGVSVVVPTVARIFPYSLIGPGDFVFLGIFSASLHRFGLKTRETFRAFFVLLTLSLVVIQLSPESWRLSIPGLVPMAAAILWANRGAVRLSRAERFATLYAVAAVGLLLLLITWLGAFTVPPEREGRLEPGKGRPVVHRTPSGPSGPEARRDAPSEPSPRSALTTSVVGISSVPPATPALSTS